MNATDLGPIRKELRLGVAPDIAFAAFTAEIGRWWPLHDGFSVGGPDAVNVSIDPREGGLIAEATRDGERHVWGTVALWDPPRRFVTSWHPGRPDGPPTELEVRFEPDGDGTRLVLEHRDWAGSSLADDRASYVGGWDTVLGRFVARLPVGA